jgi:DMSO/TMAO reductase YedYZ molybdopterin-dependent catalytic subunit
VSPIDLFPFDPASERQGFGAGLVRKPVTPVKEFYVMSKNTVDPAISPADWRLRITLDGDTLRSFTYSELLSLPRSTRYVTLRCVSNTLKSDLMGTAQWTGVRLSQLIDARRLPSGLVEAALIGVDGHGDSLPLDYAFSEHTLLAMGMNGKTLNRDHGFPLRLLAPRYYGFKNVKWIGEIALTSAPYYGTWPKMGYTKEPVIHTMSYIDRVKKQEGKVDLGGVAFAGDRGVRRVQVRADDGEWKDAVLETPLSAYTLTRWVATLDVDAAEQVECRAQDGNHQWQANREKPLFPDGVAGPTIKRVWS